MAFIVLEGLDGAGKSTQIKLIQKLLADRGGSCQFMHFPRYDAPVYGDMICRFLRGELGAIDQVNPYVVALLFAGDRGDAGHIIKDWMNSGADVILDRYVYSNIGYQCAKLIDKAQQDELRDWILDAEYNHFGIPRPDLSIFLDVPLKFTEQKLSEQREGDDRDYLHGQRDIHEESMDLQRRVRECYLSCSESDPLLRVVDCSVDGEMASPEVIFERICVVLGEHNIL